MISSRIRTFYSFIGLRQHPFRTIQRVVAWTAHAPPKTHSLIGYSTSTLVQVRVLDVRSGHLNPGHLIFEPMICGGEKLRPQECLVHTHMKCHYRPTISMSGNLGSPHRRSLPLIILGDGFGRTSLSQSKKEPTPLFLSL